MRQLHPERIEDLDVEQRYLADVREPIDGRPWVALNFATTLDGATSIDGRSKGIGGPADRLAFHALRTAADVILVGAGTARAEHYGPARVPEHLIAARAAAGRSRPPRIAVATRTLDLDLTSSLFTESEVRPLVATVEGHDDHELDRVRAVAEVFVAGELTVDLAALLGHLGRDGARFVLSEGGPHLAGSLIDAGLVDEWCLTVGPLLVSGASTRAARSGAVPPPPASLRLDRVIEADSALLLRHVRVDVPPSA